MDVLSHEEAKRMMKESHLICSLEHGYMIHVSKENPYKKTAFELPDESTCWLGTYGTGKMLKIEVDNKIALIAFILNN